MSVRDSFIFYRSFFESIEEIDQQSQLILYKAIAKYALYKQEPQINGLGMAIWKLIKPQLDANLSRYENGCKGGAHGKKGGAPKGNKNAVKTTPKQPQNNPKTTPNDNDNDNDNDNNNDNDNEDVPYRTTPTPSIDDVDLFFRENCTADDRNIEAIRFYSYFASQGWVSDDGEPVRNWRALAKKWVENWSNKPKMREAIHENDRKKRARYF